jgi:glutamate carboxypeptidase
MTRMDAVREQLDWLATQRQRMLDRVVAWSNVNSHTQNVAGVNAVTEHVRTALEELGADCSWHDVAPARTIDDRGEPVEQPLGRALRATKRHALSSGVALRVLLNIHTDTVYPIDHPFQSVTRLDENTLRGPGVIDAKGGLVVMLAAIEAMERSDLAPRVGWEVLINPDEEIGSPGSTPVLVECAKRNDLGLVYEPAFGDAGALVGERKGSGTFTIVVRGRAAHAGRDFEQGRNAVVAVARCVTDIDGMNGRFPGVTLNVGRLAGGGPVNVVPDLAVARVNVRMTKPEDEPPIREGMERAVAAINARGDGYRAELHGGFFAPPKVLDPRTRRLLDGILAAGHELGLSGFTWTSSGGVSDGNRLAAAGLPVIDSLGPRGGKLHSPDEFLLIDSLVERAQLSALVLMKIAAGEIALRHGP